MSDDRSGKKARAVPKAPKIEELQKGGKVKKSGTAGTAKVAKGRDAVLDLADAIAELPADQRVNDVITAFNDVVRHYDGVIVAYVGKRDALEDAYDEVDQLQSAIKKQKGDMQALKEKAAAMESNRRGCTCKKGDADSSQAGRCVNCTCARVGAKCSVKCGCGDYCRRPDDNKQKQLDLKSEEQWNARMKKVLAARKANAKGKARNESDDDDDEEDEEYQPRSKKNKAQKKKARSDSEEEEEEGRKAKGRGKARNESDDEARPAAAPRRQRQRSPSPQEGAGEAPAPGQDDRDPDDYDEAVDGINERLNIDENME